MLKPVRGLTNTITTMTNGDFTVDVDIRSRNEIGKMGHSVDATDVGCAAIEEVKMAFTVCQSAIGQATYAVKAAARLAQKKSLTGLDYLSENHKYIWVPFEKVDLSNVADYK